MRRATFLLPLLLFGCAGPSVSVPTEPDAKEWTRHEVAAGGLVFELPAGWQLANEVNGKIDVKQDTEALAQAKQQFDDIRMVASASESGRDAKRLLTTYTILSLKPKTLPKSEDALLKSTLADLVADYPSGDPQGTVFDLPDRKAVLTSYTDAATKGQSKGGTPDVVDVMNIQFRLIHKDRIFLLNVTGEKDRTAELQKLAEALLRHVSLN